MKKLPIKLENAVTCLYFASIIWCLLFPLVNITTGETKPRGIYVDENALLVSSGISGFPLSNNNVNSPQWLNFLFIKDSVTHNSNSVPSFCRFVTSNHAPVSCCQIEKSTGTMTKIIVDHPWKARSLEVTTIAISYHSTNKIQSLAYAAALIKRISTSNWLSKRILILLIPLQYDEEGQTAARGETRVAAFDDQNSGTQTAEGNPEHSEKQRIRFSPSLSTWLDEYHAMQPRISDNVFEVPQQPSTQICDGIIHEGLLRDAYIVDFSEPYITSIAAEHCESLGGCKEKETEKGKGKALWRTIRILIAGNNGQLPNMDFIAAPLALFPNTLTSEAETEAETEQSLSGELMTNKILAMFPKNLLPGFYDSIEKVLSRRECRQYSRVMAGLLSFSGALVEGPSGLHGQFIRRNIDALTLRPIAPATAPALSSTYQNRRARSHLSHGEKSSHGTSGFESEAEALPAAATSEEGKGEWEWAVQDLLNLLDIVEQCIRLGSNVNEELHHSLWFYILMGPKLFVGVSEYAGTLLLALCPLLALYFRLTSALKPPSATSSSTSSSTSTSSSLSLAPPLPSPFPSPSPITVTDLNHEHATDSPGTLIEQLPVTGTMRSSIDLPLLKGFYMFISDNLLMWILVFIVQPALGHQYLQWCWLTASTVNFLSCSSIVVNAYMQSSSPRETTRCPVLSAATSDTASRENEGSRNRLVEDVRGKWVLTELLTVLTMCLLISLSWVGAQHYALSLLLTLPLVPVLCTVVACGTHLGVIDSAIPVPPNPVCTALPSLRAVTGRTETETVSDHSQVLKEGSGGGLTGQNHQGVKQTVKKEHIEVENTDIDAHTSAPTSTPTTTKPSVSHTKSALAVEEPIRIRERCPLNALELKRTACRCLLLLLSCACTPSGISTVVLHFKRLFLFDPQSLQTTSPYFTALAADWINVEVASLTYPCFLLLPHMVCTASLRVILADALGARERGRDRKLD